jgi:hypothetical protein
MSFNKRREALSLAICTGPATAHAADDGVINQAEQLFGERSRHAI